MTYGISSGALRAALFAERHPERVARLALDAFVWTGQARPRSSNGARSCPPSWRRSAGRSIAPSSIRIFRATIRTAPEKRVGRRVRRRDPRARRLDAERHVHRHVLEAARRRSAKILVPTIVLRGQYDGIAASTT
jgi:pimeloyl-ACP methyl ester carboxylesterase